ADDAARPEVQAVARDQARDQASDEGADEAGDQRLRPVDRLVAVHDPVRDPADGHAPHDQKQDQQGELLPGSPPSRFVSVETGPSLLGVGAAGARAYSAPRWDVTSVITPCQHRGRPSEPQTISASSRIHTVRPSFVFIRYSS